MGFKSANSTLLSPGETVIVVIDANRSKGCVDAVDWTIKNTVRPKDTVVVLVVLPELGKRQPSCFPFQVGIGISGVWVRLEFSGGEMSPSRLEEEIEKKRQEYQSALQPFYRLCKKSEVKLEVKLAAGFNPMKITVEEAHNFNPRLIVLDSHLKKDRVYIYGHVACNVAVMKGKGVATLMPSKAPGIEKWSTESEKTDQDEGYDGNFQYRKSWTPTVSPKSPCWYPLSWRTGFPRAFSLSELEVITNAFANEDIVLVDEHREIYEGIYHETPVLAMRYSGNDDRAWSILNILSRVRHRSISNLVGYCCTADHIFLVRDYPCSGSLDLNLQCDESARNISWKARWCIALEIGAGIRYLHEECADGPIVDLSVCSAHIVFSHGTSAMLSMYHSAKWLKDNISCHEDSTGWMNVDVDERLFADVRAYGMFLVELISGKSAKYYFQEQGEGQSLVDWALPLIQNGSLSQVMDPRLVDTSDAGVEYMARAALLCLNTNSTHKYSISEVLAVVRGDQIAMTKY